MTKAWFEKMRCDMKWVRQYFNIKSSDFYTRFGYSLIPFYPNFCTLTEGSPDVYGPFWIYTTLIFVVAAAGSLSSYFSEREAKGFFQEFVPISAAIVKLEVIFRFIALDLGSPASLR